MVYLDLYKYYILSNIHTSNVDNIPILTAINTRTKNPVFLIKSMKSEW